MFNKIYNMPCQEGFALLPDQSIDCIITSPPYANQRKDQYGGISEEDFPKFTTDWMEGAKRILKPDGSILINIRPNLSDGQISDYMLHTRLLIRANGWFENEELIWVKPDGPPLGSVNRPRRCWESIHWFSLTKQPYVDLLSNGVKSDRIGFLSGKGTADGKGSSKGGEKWINGTSDGLKEGVARCKDIVVIQVSSNDKSEENIHPAQYPEGLAEWMINLVSRKGGVIIDPFMGSGTSAVAAKKLGRDYVGFEINPEYIKIAEARLGRLYTEAPGVDDIFEIEESLLEFE